jgi:hypothetical protein
MSVALIWGNLVATGAEVDVLVMSVLEEEAVSKVVIAEVVSERPVVSEGVTFAGVVNTVMDGVIEGVTEDVVSEEWIVSEGAVVEDVVEEVVEGVVDGVMEVLVESMDVDVISNTLLVSEVITASAVLDSAMVGIIVVLELDQLFSVVEDVDRVDGYNVVSPKVKIEVFWEGGLGWEELGLP